MIYSESLYKLTFANSYFSVWSGCCAGCFSSEMLSAALACPAGHLQFIKKLVPLVFILSLCTPPSIRQWENVPWSVHSWCWGLDFETWDGCRLVCVPFASGWQSNMEHVNYGTALTGVPQRAELLTCPAWVLLLMFSVNLQSGLV